MLEFELILERIYSLTKINIDISKTYLSKNVYFQNFIYY